MASKSKSKSDRHYTLCMYQLRRFLSGSETPKFRYVQFCKIIEKNFYIARKNHIELKVMEELLRDESLFPSINDFFQFTLERKHFKAVVFLQEIMSFKIHEARSADGRSAVHCLARRGCVDKYHGIVDGPTTSLINFFLKNSTENLIDEEGYSYLHGACFVGNIEAVQRFVGEGADVNLDTYECSPLHVAVQYRRADVVKFLLELGADPNQRDREQSTPLHRLSWLHKCDCGPADYTCDKRNPANLIVKMLAAKGASMDARDSSEQTPLDVAVSKCDLELSKSLLEYGASQDTLNNNGPINVNDTTFRMQLFCAI
ncbi:tankyrase-2-like [Trichogramma pretiosum]|uniref:tankyrase-2-like n=1 Tax=Trichogramma pretiosum TaxID=7493 RepID=UPI0006C9AF74|nr:tankyrase-2-like [Trichogramma pretiosum]